LTSYVSLVYHDLYRWTTSILVQGLNIPNHLRILINTPIGAEESHARHTSNAFSDPLLLVLEALINELLRLAVACKIVRDKIVVTVVNNSVQKSRELVGVTKRAFLNLIEYGGKRFVELIVAIDVAVAEFFDIFGKVPEEEDVTVANFAGNFDLDHHLVTGIFVIARKPTLAPSHVPMIRPPLRTNFMLLVPLASVPAVDMCSLISDAGTMISALLTL
jgi:hypothetical protein